MDVGDGSCGVDGTVGRVWDREFGHAGASWKLGNNAPPSGWVLKMVKELNGE